MPDSRGQKHQGLQQPAPAAPAPVQAKPQKSPLRRALNLLAFMVLLGMVAASVYGLSAIYARYIGSEVSETRPGGPPISPSGPQTQSQTQSQSQAQSQGQSQAEVINLSLYFPVEGKLYREQRAVPKPSAVRDMAAAVMAEFLAGPLARESTLIPKDGRLLGVYFGTDRILYLDFSDSFRHGFQGGVREEYLLLSAISETVMVNVSKVMGIRILIEGGEVDTLGGHLSLRGTLSEALRYNAYEAGEAGHSGVPVAPVPVAPVPVAPGEVHDDAR